MSEAKLEYAKLEASFASCQDVASGQMFGKPCLKISGKAFAAQHLDTVVFKLAEPVRTTALAMDGAKNWDPSGKGRPMKEWVALPTSAKDQFASLSLAAKSYVDQA